MIISGFAGIGKTEAAKKGLIVDLESTPFKKDWAVYANVAIHMSKSGYDVAISAHPEIRKELAERGVDYIYVTPYVEDKKHFIERYKRRGNSNGFIDLFNNKWDSFIKPISDQEKVYRVANNQFLSDIIKEIKDNH